MPYKNKEKGKQKRREYYLRHREDILAANKTPRIRQLRIEAKRRHYWRHRDSLLKARKRPEIRARDRETRRRSMQDPQRRAAVNTWWRKWYQDHRETRLAGCRARYHKNPEAHRKWARLYYQRNKERIKKQRKEYIRRNPQLRSAQEYVRLAILFGDLTRPDSCEICEEKAHKIVAHHRDYSKPLDVLWVCWGCHQYIHYHERKEKEGET